jgi:hydroxyacylglutathione hydrolase
MNIETIAVGEFQANCFVAWGDTKEAIIIDPGAEPEVISSFLTDNSLSVACYLLTHGHVDHISAITDLHKSLPAPIGIHPEDLKWAFQAENQFAPFYTAPQRPSEIERELEDHQTFNDGGLKYEVICTPGHSPGSVSFYFEEHQVLFAGDTLFAGSIGRTDLPGGDMEMMNESLKLLAKMPKETRVYTGHGPSTTIDYEKKNNFFMMRQET